MELTLATRRSKLALAQSRAFARLLESETAGLTVHELEIVTSGDRHQEVRLQDIGGKGLFIKELEEALYDRRADFAVHSIKDVPAQVAPRLVLACIPSREDPRDVLVTRSGQGLADLPAGSRIGTSSLRREVCLHLSRPDLVIEPVRGNVDTRLRKVDEGELDGIVLALAGLKRLGLAERATEILEVDVSLPAIGQGALGIESREDDDGVRTVLAVLEHPETATCVSAERALMASVDGSCRTPVAAYAVRDGGELWLRGLLAEPDGSRPRRAERRVSFPGERREAERVGRDLGLELKGM
jgi:hydroxymethylbilane synthase